MASWRSDPLPQQQHQRILAATILWIVYATLQVFDKSSVPDGMTRLITPGFYGHVVGLGFAVAALVVFLREPGAWPLTIALLLAGVGASMLLISIWIFSYGGDGLGILFRLILVVPPIVSALNQRVILPYWLWGLALLSSISVITAFMAFDLVAIVAWGAFLAATVLLALATMGKRETGATVPPVAPE